MLKTLYADRNGRTLLVTQNPEHRHARAYWHTIVFGPDGTQLDTIPEPWIGYERPGLRAERELEGGGSMWVPEDVPFTPDFYWTIHPSGHLLTGFSTEYRLELARDRTGESGCRCQPRDERFRTRPTTRTIPGRNR